MRYDLPTAECNVFNGAYIDSYNNNLRTRYYLHEGSLIPSSTQVYTQLPQNSHCLTSQEVLEYKPEYQVWFSALALGVCILAFVVIYNTIIKRLLP